MTAPPRDFADRPAAPAPEDGGLPPDADGPPHDLLSELLRSVRLSGDRILSYLPQNPFSVSFADQGCLHVIEAGGVTLRIDGDPQVRHLARGDFVLLPRGDRHSISSVEGSARAITPDTAPGTAPGTTPEDDAVPARWLCGTFTIGDPQASHLLGALPAVIILRAGDGGLSAEAVEGLEVARRMLVIEMQSPSQGSAVMVARILDLIFIQILRLWASGTDAEPNWLAGAFDPQIGLALSAIHRTPAHDWTVDELARVCSLSRSSFASRFVARVGRPPAAYLAHVRLDAATDLLRDTTLPVALVAKKVGYLSEAAFSRAFKIRYGTPPAHWRRDMRSFRPSQLP
ncbi:MAG: AraC family transcriptional regulator [Catenulispora sp.]|nr:AraC family transcriptional regulator [Catenulispora sp.]